ncbi:unnamed protein product [Hapterophycus canaliculatus]
MVERFISIEQVGRSMLSTSIFLDWTPSPLFVGHSIMDNAHVWIEVQHPAKVLGVGVARSKRVRPGHRTVPSAVPATDWWCHQLVNHGEFELFEFPRKVTSGRWLTTPIDHGFSAFPRNGTVKKLTNEKLRAPFTCNGPTETY